MTNKSTTNEIANRFREITCRQCGELVFIEITHDEFQRHYQHAQTMVRLTLVTATMEAMKNLDNTSTNCQPYYFNITEYQHQVLDEIRLIKSDGKFVIRQLTDFLNSPYFSEFTLDEFNAPGGKESAVSYPRSNNVVKSRGC